MVTASTLSDPNVPEFSDALDGDLIFGERGGGAFKWTWATFRALVFSRDVGEVKGFAMATPPPGYLVCDGAEVSRTIYAELFAAIGTTWGVGDGTNTFNLPNYEGKFRRAWDNGAGVDPGRVFGESQAADVESHVHAVNITSGNQSQNHHHGKGTLDMDDSGTHTHGVPAGQDTSGTGFSTIVAEVATKSNNSGSATTGSGNHKHNLTGITGENNVDHTHDVAGNTDAYGGTETRPINETELVCIRYV